MIPVILIIVSSYGLGCLVAAYYVARWLDGRDVRRLGSGNAGATNLRRSHGPGPAAVALLLDAGKAAAAVALAHYLLPVEWSRLLAVVAVIAGHVWPIQLGFRGGKGVASAVGGLLAADVTASLLTIAFWLVVLVITRRFTFSGLVAIAVAPVSLVLLHRPWPNVALAALAISIVLIAHHPRADARRRAALAETGP